jgi:hypothetical protein
MLDLTHLILPEATMTQQAASN